MLLDDYSSASKSGNVNKLQVVNRFLQVLIDSGLSKHEAEKHLKPEEKELLEEAKYMEARKKEFGRK
jgi:Flp pilus assembly CpaE family ATPase